MFCAFLAKKSNMSALFRKKLFICLKHWRNVSLCRWKERFELLVQKGWKRSSQDRKEEIQLLDEYCRRIKKKRYKTGKTGRLEQINDKTKIFILCISGKLM